ncbi:hypothetical protein [uncultured Alsobacter sp.]|uniref:hypothetical protein n=1 Tax=uncultured Alsobacter sp. TaxID=1748258 RepID=UPI0025EC06B5|nr:hypothetical protein [uncultured Alsobacter sp.]
MKPMKPKRVTRGGRPIYSRDEAADRYQLKQLGQLPPTDPKGIERWWKQRGY